MLEFTISMAAAEVAVHAILQLTERQRPVDIAIGDRARKARRHVANELTDEDVGALLHVAERHHSVATAVT